MKVSKLLALELPRDREVLGKLSWPPAYESDDATVEELGDIAKHFGALGVQLAREDFGGGEWFWSVMRVVGAYFGASLYELATKDRPAAALEVLREIDGALTGEDVACASAEARIQRGQAEELLGSFAFCASRLLFAADVDEMEVWLGQLTEKYDADLTAISALETFHEEVEGFDAEPLEVADELLSLSFEFRRVTVERRFESWSRARESSPLVGIEELTMLSARREAVIEKWGSKQVERVFEQKLWVIFQALGFFVVPARPGETVADLLCISDQSEKWSRQFSFLVDAKSSRDPYKFPKADQRAIADYVEMPEDTPGIPPLAFVLIVGSQRADTVPQKMRDLELETGVPIKFSRADLIALLHQELAAPVSPQTFRMSVLNSSSDLTEALIKDLKADREAGISAYTNLIRSHRSRWR